MTEGKKILHITSHMGGGVGQAISELVCSDMKNVHEIMVLDKPEKMQYIEKCKDHRIKVIFPEECKSLKEKINGADIVIVHWWHHPAMYKFLTSLPEISCRLFLWCHVSGQSYPYLNPKWLDCAEKIFITTPYTFENKFWKKNNVSFENLIYMPGMGRLKALEEKVSYELVNKNEIRIGCVGTFTKSKLNPEFANICKSIIDTNKDAHIYMLGDLDTAKWIIDETKKIGLEKNVHFEGFVSNINEWLKSFDIFLYPLNPYHFGATENALIEAMTVGLPIIALNQSVEKYILKNDETGILVDDIGEISKAVTYLASDEKIRKKLGKAAHKAALNEYEYDSFIEQFDKVIESDGQKKNFEFKKIMGADVYSNFMFGVNPEDEAIIKERKLDLLPDIYWESNKGSIIHFERYFKTNFLKRGR